MNRYSDICSPEVLDTIIYQPIVNALRGTPPAELIESGRKIPEASRLFNAHMVACHHLQRYPDATLVGKEIRYFDTPSQMGKYLITLLGQSLSRDSKQSPAFESRGKTRGRDICFNAESLFVGASGHTSTGSFLRTAKRKTELFHDENGTLIFAKKALHVGSAISTHEISINGIDYPSGMLLDIKRHPHYPASKVHPALDAYPLAAIEDIAPLRMSGFAFRPSEFAKVFMPQRYDDTLFNDTHSAYFAPDTGNLTLDELLAPLQKVLTDFNRKAM